MISRREKLLYFENELRCCQPVHMDHQTCPMCQDDSVILVFSECAIVKIVLRTYEGGREELVEQVAIARKYLNYKLKITSLSCAPN